MASGFQRIDARSTSQEAQGSSSRGSSEPDQTDGELQAALSALAMQKTQLLKREQEFAQLKGWFDLVLNHMLRGVSLFDAEQRLLFCNKAYQEIYELPDHLTKRGTPLADLVRFHVRNVTGRDGADDIASQQAWIEQHIDKLARGEMFSHTQHLNGGRIVIVTNKPLPDGGWVDFQEDITERRKAEQQTNWLARHDPLTEIANRLQFREALQSAVENLRPMMGFALHWIDLDRFKEVNDTLGHPVGDALLRSVANRLRESVRESDVVARLGGDEFAVLQAGAEDWDTAEQCAKRLLRAVSEPHRIQGQSVDCGASIGIALAPQHGRSAEDLIKSADVALYAAKKAGKNGFAFAELDASEPVRESTQRATVAG
jgi:diguanylate cyclase (GGDEF)-like protein